MPAESLLDHQQIDAATFRAKRLCHRVAPHDLAEQPLYILTESMLPESERQDRCVGYTDCHLDIQCREFLHERWDGRGAAMVINDLRLWDSIEPAPEALTSFHRCFDAIALHELGHVLERDQLYSGLDDANRDTVQQFRSASLTLLRTMPPLNTPNRDGPLATIPRWIQHGSGFIRIIIHLHFRAGLLASWMPLGMLFYGPHYGLFDARDYAAALGDEPQRMARCSFADIKQTEPPAAFIALWQRDLEREAQQRQQEQSNEPTAVCA